MLESIAQTIQDALRHFYVRYKPDPVLNAAENSFIMNQEVLRFLLQLNVCFK